MYGRITAFAAPRYGRRCDEKEKRKKENRCPRTRFCVALPLFAIVQNPFGISVRRQALLISTIADSLGHPGNPLGSRSSVGGDGAVSCVPQSRSRADPVRAPDTPRVSRLWVLYRQQIPLASSWPVDRAVEECLPATPIGAVLYSIAFVLRFVRYLAVALIAGRASNRSL